MHPLLNPTGFNALEIFQLDFSKAVLKNRYGALHRKWERQHETAVRKVLNSSERKHRQEESSIKIV